MLARRSDQEAIFGGESNVDTYVVVGYTSQKTQTLEAMIHHYFPNINLCAHRVAPKGEYKGEHDGWAGILKGYIQSYPRKTGGSVNSSLEFGSVI